MDRRGSARPEWVWAALVLQCVVFLIGAWSAGQMILLWSRYAAYGVQWIPHIVQSIVAVMLLGISLMGLWQSKR